MSIVYCHYFNKIFDYCGSLLYYTLKFNFYPIILNISYFFFIHKEHCRIFRNLIIELLRKNMFTAFTKLSVR